MEFFRQQMKSRVALAVSICFEMTSVLVAVLVRIAKIKILTNSAYHMKCKTDMLRPTKNTRVSSNMPKIIKVGRSEILFIFCQLFVCLFQGKIASWGLVFNKITIKPINNEENNI